MLKRFTFIALAMLMVLGLSGCFFIRDDGSGIWSSYKSHTQQHLLVAHHAAVEMHREIDWMFFDLDVRDPDDY